MQQTGNSRIMLLAFIFLLVSLYSFCEEERLDLDKKVTVTLSKFVKKEEGWYTTGDQMVPVSDTDPASIELQFPAEWNIVKFIIYAGKVRYSNGIDGTKNVSSMYNFEIQTRNKQNEYRQFRTYSENTLTKIEIKEKVPATGIKIKLKPAKPGLSGTFGTAALEIWGFKGPLPKQEKIKIKTKEDAKKALKLDQISPAEYIQLLKTLPE